jgi:hypothetical protein
MTATAFFGQIALLWQINGSLGICTSSPKPVRHPSGSTFPVSPHKQAADEV